MDSQNNQQPTATPQQPVTAQPKNAQQPQGQPEMASQYFAQPQAAPVQYVVQAESLKGVKGWLMFFVIVFALSGIGYVSIFFNAMSNNDGAQSVIDMIFGLPLSLTALAAVVTISMQKKLGKYLAMGFLGVTALYSVVGTLVNESARGNVPQMLGTIFAGLIFTGLLILYFAVSKRVKETLVS